MGQGKWTLKRNDDGYWFWQHSDGIRESPIFCVRELARRWKRGVARLKRRGHEK